MSVGKSSILRMFCENRFLADSPHTLGVEFGTKIVSIEKHRIKLQIWDTAGQERFRAVTRSYYRGAVGALLVYDITRRPTFNSLMSWLSDARNLTKPDTVMLLIGNKKDLDATRAVSFEEAESWARENGLLFLETSAQTGEAVEEAFVKAARAIYKQVEASGFDGLSSGASKPSSDGTSECAC